MASLQLIPSARAWNRVLEARRARCGHPHAAANPSLAPHLQGDTRDPVVARGVVFRPFRFVCTNDTELRIAHFHYLGPMGVGAVFISTLAVTKLPDPASPPQTQEDLLALTLQPIVSFVVLCSIFTREQDGRSVAEFSY
jgi:hypothetical protein